MKQQALIIAIIVILLAITGLVMPASGAPLTLISNISPFESPYGTISVNATVAHYSITDLPVYHGFLREGESVNKIFHEPQTCQNVTPPEEASELAKKVLEPYGGLPMDAVSNGAFTQYERVYNYTLGQYVSAIPEATTISYSQKKINGLWTIGDSNYIRVDLGENGELLRVVKIWRNYTFTGDVPVIPINTALEKLHLGELINEPIVMMEDITIDMASPGYYAKKIGSSDAVLEPIWIMYGNTTSGSRVGFYVYARQFANYTATPSEVTMFQPVQFMDTSGTTPTQWYWEFGDGTNSTEQNPSHLYTTGGNYTVNLTVWNDMGSDTISREDYVHIYYSSPAPVASFTSNYSSGNSPVLVVSPVTIQFKDLSLVSGNNIQWFWDFDDGTNSTEQNPVHTFTYRDLDNCDYYDCVRTSYVITLTVTDNYGRPSTIYDYYSIYRDTHIDFSGEPVAGASPLTVDFTEMPDDIFEFMVAMRSWDFGDGSSYVWIAREGVPFPTNLSHTYTSEGKYTVTFSKEINDAGGLFQKTKEQYITVQESSNLPVADFTANITAGRSPLAVAFSDQSVNSPTNWNWNFGDGTGSSDQSPVHVYTTAGTYTVSLTAANGYGEDSTTKVDYITVYEPLPPLADFNANVTSGYEPLAVAFSDTSANEPEQWNWSFGDGATSTEKDPVHVYYTPGVYPVSLQVTNEYGTNMKVRTDYITVLWAYPTQTIAVPPTILPVADFTANTTAGNVPLAVLFTDISTGFPTSWSWSFGDGSVSAERNPLHVYTTAGQFSVSLQVTNDDGSNTTIKEQYVRVSDQNTTPDQVIADIRIEPETLNMNSHGVFTAFITLPATYSVTDINADSLFCEGAHAKSGKVINTRKNEYMAKFERQDLKGISPGDAVTFIVTGKFITDGNAVDFQGSDTIRVINSEK
jgi:PKD repeat protein